MSHRLSDLSWEAFRETVPARIDLVLVPVGTLEAHGPLGLGTDTIIPTALAEDLAPELPALVAPAVAYGVTNSLLPYPGSTTVSPATFEAYLFEAAAGLADAGFRRIVLFNGHGGQSREVAAVVGRLWSSRRVFTAAVEWWGLADEASRDIYPGIVSGHAGVEETAMVLAARPEAVDAARAAGARRRPLQPGIKARPFPATIMLDRPEASGEGAPVLDAERAARFYGRVRGALRDALADLFEGWRDLRP